jgi:hypothetical protein
MAFRSIFTKTGQWLQKIGQKKEKQEGTSSLYNEIAAETAIVTDIALKTEQDASLAKLEKLEEDFSNMINQLEDINGHLESLPGFVENQKLLTGKLIDYIRSNAETEERLIDAVQQMPVETAKANKRVMWMFSLIVGVCLLVILSLAGIIIYFK